MPYPQCSARPTNCELEDFFIHSHNISYNIDSKQETHFMMMKVHEMGQSEPTTQKQLYQDSNIAS